MGQGVSCMHKFPTKELDVGINSSSVAVDVDVDVEPSWRVLFDEPEPPVVHPHVNVATTYPARCTREAQCSDDLTFALDGKVYESFSYTCPCALHVKMIRCDHRVPMRIQKATSLFLLRWNRNRGTVWRIPVVMSLKDPAWLQWRSFFLREHDDHEPENSGFCAIYLGCHTDEGWIAAPAHCFGLRLFVLDRYGDPMKRAPHRCAPWPRSFRSFWQWMTAIHAHLATDIVALPSTSLEYDWFSTASANLCLCLARQGAKGRLESFATFARIFGLTFDLLLPELLLVAIRRNRIALAKWLVRHNPAFICNFGGAALVSAMRLPGTKFVAWLLKQMKSQFSTQTSSMYLAALQDATAYASYYDYETVVPKLAHAWGLVRSLDNHHCFLHAPCQYTADVATCHGFDNGPLRFYDFVFLYAVLGRARKILRNALSNQRGYLDDELLHQAFCYARQSESSMLLELLSSQSNGDNCLENNRLEHDFEEIPDVFDEEHASLDERRETTPPNLSDSWTNVGNGNVDEINLLSFHLP